MINDFGVIVLSVDAIVSGDVAVADVVVIVDVVVAVFDVVPITDFGAIVLLWMLLFLLELMLSNFETFKLKQSRMPDFTSILLQNPF